MHSCRTPHTCVNTPGSFTCQSSASSPSLSTESETTNDDDLHCPNGSVWNVELRQCELPLMLPLPPSEVPAAAPCPSGTVWNTASMECEVADCPSGMTLSSETGRCERDSPGTGTQQSFRCPSGFAWSLISHQCEGSFLSLIYVLFN